MLRIIQYQAQEGSTLASKEPTRVHCYVDMDTTTKTIVEQSLSTKSMDATLKGPHRLAPGEEIECSSRMLPDGFKGANYLYMP